MLFPIVTKCFTFSFSFGVSVMTQAHIFACCDVFHFNLAISILPPRRKSDGVAFSVEWIPLRLM